jgi:hypothetical protein
MSSTRTVRPGRQTHAHTATLSNHALRPCGRPPTRPCPFIRFTTHEKRGGGGGWVGIVARASP